MSNKKWLGLLLVVSGGIFWGASGTVAQLLFASNPVDPLWIVGVRMLVAGILLLLLVAASRQSLVTIWKAPQHRHQLLWFSLLGMLPSQLFYFLAIRFGNAATATILQFTGPVFIVLYLSIAHRRMPSKRDLLAVGCAVLGTMLLVTQGHWNTLTISGLGLLFGLLAGGANASYTLTPGQLLQTFDPKLVCGWAMLIGGLPMLPFVIVRQQLDWNWAFTGELLFIVIVGTMLAYGCYIASLRYLSPAITGVMGAFEPLTATGLAVTWLGLQLNWVAIVGGALILLMAVMQALPQSKPA